MSWVQSKTPGNGYRILAPVKGLNMYYLNLNKTAEKEHDGDIERQIRVVKERIHYHKSQLTFKNTPTLLLAMLEN